jgi:hypothetical protein
MPHQETRNGLVLHKRGGSGLSPGKPHLPSFSILLNSLKWEVHGTSPAFQQRHGTNDPEFGALLQAQTNLGWSQLFQGRLVTNWGRLQEQFLQIYQAELKLDRRYYTRPLWVRKVISLLWGAMRKQWDLRNEDRHGTTTATNHAKRHTRLLKSITGLYKEKPLMLAADRNIFPSSPDNMTKQHPVTLCALNYGSKGHERL